MKSGKSLLRNVLSKRKRSDSEETSALQRCENHPNSASPVHECGICIEPVKTRGMLDCCGHVFCYSCITKWTKRSSLCPHCKREISIISKSCILGKKVISKHPVKKRNLRDTLDREEFQQRRRQLLQRERERTRNGLVSLNGNLFQEPAQLLSVHQSIRDNMMTRFSSAVRGLQDNMMLFHRVQRPIVPINFELCNLSLPAMWTDLSFGLNSGLAPQPPSLFQTQTFTFPNVQQMQNTFASPPNTMQYANIITQELANTLASLSNSNPATVLQTQAQNLLLNYLPGNGNDSNHLQYFER